jgi:hypothetical protein
MIYRGTGFLAVLLFGSSRTLFSPSRQQAVSLSQSSCVSPVELTDGRKAGKGVGGAKSYDREKVWPSINHSILTALKHLVQTYHLKYDLNFHRMLFKSLFLSENWREEESGEEPILKSRIKVNLIWCDGAFKN